jgi:hypothetical protein
MNLKQSIVIVSEFSVKDGSSKGGSRGGTPGDYVTRYMARNTATETCTPVKLFDYDDYMLRYMARDSATEPLFDRDAVKPEIKEIEQYGGVAFGRHNGKDDVSLSDEKLRDLSKDIQANFEQGKVVLKTILSFDEEYLREYGIVSADFKCRKKGDYRGNIDQMKLRMAIMNGLDRMSKNYDKLNYVGVIQVDTEHVHCHLAMVDKGRGLKISGQPMLKNGEQRGKIPEKVKNTLRRGVDSFLDESKTVAFMKSSVDFDKQNTVMFVRRAAYRTMQNNGMGQFLLACLPSDQRLWRADTNNKTLQKANTVARDYVRACFARPESGYSKVQAKIKAYANFRRDKEGLDKNAHTKLIRDGERQVESECVNSIYNSLKTISKSNKQIRTPMLDVMSIPIEEISGEDELSKFAYNLRSYSARIIHANKSRDKARAIVRDYEKSRDTGVNVEESRPVYEFFKFEEDYQEKILSKYRHFLTFIPPAERYRSEYKELLEFRQKCIDLNNMLNDTHIKRFKSEEKAEEYGLKLYNHSGGRFMVIEPGVVEARRDIIFEELSRRYDDLSYRLVRDGLILEEDEKDGQIPKIRRGLKHEFQDVKALDLHHLGYDNQTDIRISKVNLDVYLQATAQRATLAEQAKLYLESSGQKETLGSLPIKDIELMESTAKQLAPQQYPILPSLSRKATEKAPRSATTKLDYNLEIQEVVDRTLDSLENDDFYSPFGKYQ